MLTFQEAQFVTDAMQDVLQIDGLMSSHPVYQPVNHPDQISQVFDTIAYSKVLHYIILSVWFL